MLPLAPPLWPLWWISEKLVRDFVSTKSETKQTFEALKNKSAEKCSF